MVDTRADEVGAPPRPAFSDGPTHEMFPFMLPHEAKELLERGVRIQLAVHGPGASPTAGPLVRGPGGSSSSQGSESGGAEQDSEGSAAGNEKIARVWSSERHQEWHRFLGNAEDAPR